MCHPLASHQGAHGGCCGISHQWDVHLLFFPLRLSLRLFVAYNGTFFILFFWCFGDSLAISPFDVLRFDIVFPLSFVFSFSTRQVFDIWPNTISARQGSNRGCKSRVDSREGRTREERRKAVGKVCKLWGEESGLGGDWEDEGHSAHIGGKILRGVKRNE